METVHHVWLMLLLARARCIRGRLADAEATCREAGRSVRELADPGRVSWLAVDVGREIARARSRAATGELLEPPSKAELAVLCLLESELSVRQIGEQLFLSANTVRTHTRAIYRKLDVNSRTEAVARADALGLFADSNHLGEPACEVSKVH